MGAYGAVNLYNVLKHSTANSMEDFLVPLLSSNYMEGILHLDMPLYPCAYMAVILSAYFGQHGLTFIRNKEWKNFGKISSAHVFRAGIGLICAAAVLAMSTGTVLQFSQNSQIKANFHNMEDFEELAAQVAEMVPENTPAFGINIPEIYSLLHRRTECFTMDFSDMLVRPDSLKELQDQLEHAEIRGAKNKKSSMRIWKRNDPETYRWFREHYKLKDTISFQQEEFQYYIEK